jgi:hypothetical protein
VNVTEATSPTSASFDNGGSTEGRRFNVLFAPWASEQCRLPAKGLQDLGHSAVTMSFSRRGGDRQPLDIVLEGRGPFHRRLDKAMFFLWAAAHFDIFHFFHGFSLLPHRLDLPLLRSTRGKVVAHFRGGDVRSREWLLAQNEGRTALPLQTTEQARAVDRWGRYASCMLVSTPDLLELVPGALWIPQMIDLDQWEAPTRKWDREKRPFRLVHAPSSAGKKGTRHVIEAVSRLQERGLAIELDLLTGGDRQKVASALARADAGVDQLLVGWYGNAGIEMMAHRLPLLCYVRDDLRHHAPSLPLLSARPSTLEADIARLVEMSDDERKVLGDEGRTFVEENHEIRVVCRQLLDVYRSL